MPFIFINEVDLEKRRKQLPGRFKRLFRKAPYIGSEFEPLGSSSRAIGVKQGPKGPLTHTDWRVSLIPGKVAMGYFEIWSNYKGSSFVLKNISLHLCLQKVTEEDELILIHTELKNADGVDFERYKNTPHLHFAVAEYPWSKIHIPLCDGFESVVMKSLDSLDDALTRVVDFIRDQVLPLI